LRWDLWRSAKHLATAAFVRPQVRESWGTCDRESGLCGGRGEAIAKVWPGFAVDAIALNCELDGAVKMQGGGRRLSDASRCA
jgi:hypothetical protein